MAPEDRNLPANVRLTDASFLWRQGRRIHVLRRQPLVTLDDLIEEWRHLRQLQGSDQCSVLLDLRRVVDMPADAGDQWGGSDSVRSIVAVSIVADLDVGFSLGNTLTRAAWTATYPVRVFGDPHRAAGWLSEHDGEPSEFGDLMKVAGDVLGGEFEGFWPPGPPTDSALTSEQVERQLAQLGRFVRALIERDFSKKLDLSSLEGDTFKLFGAAINLLGEEVKLLIRSQKRIEEDLRRKIETAARLSALGEMAGCIVHEIKNPIAIIQGKARQIRRFMEGENISSPVVERYVNVIESTSDRIVQIMQGIRAFSHDGSQDLMKREKLELIIQESLHMVSARFKVQGIEMRYQPVSHDIEVYCTSVQIGQVLLNLLNNAFDATVDLAEKWVELKVIENEDSVEIQLTDSGPGIPQEIVDRIFQPFFTTKPAGKGTGLGLGIAMSIIERHQGRLKVDTECPHTRFIIELPKSAARVNRNSA